MSDWSHGYNTSQGYTYNFYREMSPHWIDFGMRLAGHKRACVDKRRYLELGSGQGLGLALLAAANPQMEFVGIDFNPEHIAHARMLAYSAGLTNVRFEEGDFLALATNWPENLGQFDDAALHGIISWVGHTVRAAIIECIQSALRPGGSVYVSYNALPGWLSAYPLQHLLRSHEKTSNLPQSEAIDSALALLRRLESGKAGVFQSLPFLSKKLEQAEMADRAYLVQEYLHDEAWYPLWHSQVVKEMARAKLQYIGTATLPEVYLPAMLPDTLKSIVLEYRDPVVRQDMIDACINQSFRRDLFLRGAIRTWPGQVEPSWRDCQFMALKLPPNGDFNFDAGFAKLSGDAASYGALMTFARIKPRSVQDFLSLPEWRGKALATLLQSISFLMHGDFLVPFQKDAVVEPAICFNRTLAELVSAGAPYNALACARTGSGLIVSPSELMMLDVVARSSAALTEEDVADGLLTRLGFCGFVIKKGGQALSDPTEAKTEAKRLAKEFLENTLQYWKLLGAWV